MAALAWAWTGIAGGLLGRALGVPVGAGDAGGWAGSGPTAIDQVIAPLLTPTAIAIGLTWVGGAILLGLLLDVASPGRRRGRGPDLGGRDRRAARRRRRRSGADAAARPGPDRRRRLGDLGPRRPARPAAAGRAAQRRKDGGATRPSRDRYRGTAPRPEGRIARRPRNPAALPPADERIRATRTATKHVRAALHGAGSHAGLP